MTIAAIRTPIVCHGCSQWVAWYWPDGTLVPIGAVVTKDRDGRVRIRCPRCGKWIKPKV